MKSPPKPFVTVLSAWALAFGCALGWDAAVLPWTEFLPKAGPLGTILGIFAGGLVMSVIAWNYHFMMNRHPGPGGAYSYVAEVLGVDHGFLCGWFLCFAYASIIWLDATVLAYFFHHLTGGNFHLGFHYFVAGHEVCLVHILLSVLAIAIATAVCCRIRFALRVETALSVALALCALLCLAGVLVRRGGGGADSFLPAFAPGKVPWLMQTLGVVVYSPWLFIGFEAISHVSGDFAFPRRKSFGVMLAALFAVVAAYSIFSLVPALVPSLATGFGNWTEAVESVTSDTANDIAYGTIGRCFGPAGRLVVLLTFVAAVYTNLVGNAVAASRLLAAMADDGSLPAWFGRKNGGGAPRNAVLAIAGFSLIVFLLGETVIGVVVDIALVGAALAYAYTSAATFATARREGGRLALATGLVGVVVSSLLVALFVLPVFSSHFITMARESLLVIIFWCLAGLLAFLSTFRRDRSGRFGKSPVVWVVFFAIIVFISTLWTRQVTYDLAGNCFDGIVAFHNENCKAPPGRARYLERSQVRSVVRRRQRKLTEGFLSGAYAQAGLSVAAMVLMLSILRIITRRERLKEEEKARAKSQFFSAVSHDIRTPLNAIIGFSEMLGDGRETPEDRKKAVDSILVSGKTLLALVNDILDLSKLESGRMEILPEPTDCGRLVREVADIFRATGLKPGVELRTSIGEMPPLMLDPQRIRQIAFNFIGNAAKFTDRGHVEIRAFFSPGPGGSAAGDFRLEVEDTGCGISEEDLKRIFAPYVQVGSSRSRRKGTGLGLSICKQLAEAMGGRFDVVSQLGRGSTFSVTVPCRTAPAPAPSAAAAASGEAVEAALPHRILVADDSKTNYLVLLALLSKIGRFDVVPAMDGAHALQILKTPGGKPFDLVLTDMWMPKLDGEGLVKAIRADPALAGLRVVAVTADVEARGREAEMGFDGILLKPITSETLRAAISVPVPERKRS